MEKTTEISTDVLVIGGCSAGLYFAGLMAKQGYKVLVCDKAPEEKLGAQYDIIHIMRKNFERFGLHEPEPGDPEYVANFTRNILRSAKSRRTLVKGRQHGQSGGKGYADSLTLNVYYPEAAPGNAAVPSGQRRRYTETR